MRTMLPRWLWASAVAALGLLLAPSASPASAEEPQLPPGVRGEILQWIGDAEEKLLDLADATPEEKYAWRPAEGVRTQGEVFLHVAAANYALPGQWGMKPPEGFAFEGYEKSMTKKADIRAALQSSFTHMKNGFLGLSDEALAREATVFGRAVTVRWGYLLLLSHAHEHLGQSIAYARSNGITPPWTARRQEEQEKAKAKGSGG